MEKFQELCITIGQRIRQYREEQGITLKEMSVKTKIREKYLQKIEAGRAYGVKTAQILLIIKILKIHPKVLFKGF